MLKVEDLSAEVAGRPVVRGVSMEIPPGEVHALMGPNGSGKTSFALALMGHPRYRVTGRARLDGVELLSLPPHERVRAGLFLAFQHPVEVPGVTVYQFLRAAVAAARGREPGLREFYGELEERMRQLELDPSFARRGVNEGFSGGEKKRHEMVQMLLLRPRFAFLDEPDSGLDVDGLKAVARAVNSLRGPHFSCLIITHYPRILKEVPPDRVHVMVEGEIVRSGGPELARLIDEEGYEWLRG